jgi:dienelactone hydrolase
MKFAGTFTAVVVSILLMAQPAFSYDLEYLKPHMEQATPDGSGPFPAVMMISGCSGFRIAPAHYANVKNQLTELGFLVIYVDSLNARGEVKCDRGGVSVRDQVADIQAAAEFLRSQPNVKKDAINVIGWSWGGRGTLAAAIVGKGIDTAIAYYPSCRRLSNKAVNVPTLVLFGEADNVAPIGLCKEIFSASKKLVLKSYPGAHHVFDNPKFDPPREYRFGTIGYSASAAKAAWTELKNFLKR